MVEWLKAFLHIEGADARVVGLSCSNRLVTIGLIMRDVNHQI
jgi:hypothetical protein